MTFKGFVTAAAPAAPAKDTILATDTNEKNSADIGGVPAVYGNCLANKQDAKEERNSSTTINIRNNSIIQSEHELNVVAKAADYNSCDSNFNVPGKRESISLAELSVVCARH